MHGSLWSIIFVTAESHSYYIFLITGKFKEKKQESKTKTIEISSKVLVPEIFMPNRLYFYPCFTLWLENIHIWAAIFIYGYDWKSAEAQIQWTSKNLCILLAPCWLRIWSHFTCSFNFRFFCKNIKYDTKWHLTLLKSLIWLLKILQLYYHILKF